METKHDADTISKHIKDVMKPQNIQSSSSFMSKTVVGIVQFYKPHNKDHYANLVSIIIVVLKGLENSQSTCIRHKTAAYTKSISTSGGSTLPLTRISTDFPLRTAMFTWESNFMTAFGVSVAEIRVTPPTGTTPQTGDSTKPGNGLGLRICKKQQTKL